MKKRILRWWYIHQANSNRHAAIAAARYAQDLSNEADSANRFYTKLAHDVSLRADLYRAQERAFMIKAARLDGLRLV